MVPHRLGHAQLRDGVRAGLLLEADQPLRKLAELCSNDLAIDARGASHLVDDLHQERSGSHGRVDHTQVRSSEAVTESEPCAKDVVDEPHHEGDDRARREVRAGLLAQLGVVDGKELLVQGEVCAAGAVVQQVPVHGSDDAPQRLYGGRDPPEHPPGREDVQRLAHEGVALAEQSSDLFDRPILEVDVLHPGEQEREGDRLRVGVGKLVVVEAGKQRTPPIVHEAGEFGLAVPGSFIPKRYSYLVAQQATEAGNVLDEPVKVPRRLRNPFKEVGKDAEQFAIGWLQAGTGALDASADPSDPSNPLPCPVQRPTVPVGIQDVGQ